ncbi:hypothetical protein LguiB_001919 [Lonicera macranthoides]
MNEMISSWFKGVFFRFLRRSAVAIDCLFGSCFRVQDYDDSLSHTHIPSDARDQDQEQEPVVVSRNRNRLYSLLPSQEKDVFLPCEAKERHVLGTPQPDIEVGELDDKDKSLKGCGTLSKTPAEILKVSEEVKDSTRLGGDSNSSKFHSIQMLSLDNQPEQSSTPTKPTEEWVNKSGSLSCTPCSCLTSKEKGSSTQDNGDGSVITDVKFHANQSKTSPGALVATVQSKNKSVRFECDSSLSSFSSKSSSSSESGSQSTEQSEPAGEDHSLSKPSPYPTPFKLTDEMQTPGTVFPSYLEVTRNGKNPRIRSQYVYSLMSPSNTFSQPKKVLKEEDTKCNQLSEFLEEEDDESTPKSKVGMSEGSLEKELNVESSLSSWCRLAPSNQNGNNEHLFRTPNLATKYKEEAEKVDLHATPFEERLENALSSGDNTSISY